MSMLDKLLGDNHHTKVYINGNKIIEHEREVMINRIIAGIFIVIILIVFFIFFLANFIQGWNSFPSKNLISQLIYVLPVSFFFGLILTPVVKIVMKYFVITPLYVNKSRANNMHPRELKVLSIKRFFIYWVIGLVFSAIVFILILSPALNFDGSSKSTANIMSGTTIVKPVENFTCKDLDCFLKAVTNCTPATYQYQTEDLIFSEIVNGKESGYKAISNKTIGKSRGFMSAVNSCVVEYYDVTALLITSSNNIINLLCQRPSGSSAYSCGQLLIAN